MKNRRKNIVIAVLVGIAICVAYTLNIVPTSESMGKNLRTEKSVQVAAEIPGGVVLCTLGGNTFEPIGADELPQAVRSGVATRYVAYSVKEVLKNKEDIYKLILKSESGKMIAYYSADGEYLKDEVVKPVQVIALN